MLPAVAFVESVIELDRNEPRNINMLGNEPEEPCNISLRKNGKINKGIEEA